MMRLAGGLERRENRRQDASPARGTRVRIEHRQQDPLASLKKRSHADLVRAVVSACNMIPGVFVFPVDVARVEGRKRTLGMAGTPDVLGWRCVGPWGLSYAAPIAQMIAFECKVGRDVLRPTQRAFLDKLRAAGGIAAEIRAADEAVNLLKSRR